MRAKSRSVKLWLLLAVAIFTGGAGSGCSRQTADITTAKAAEQSNGAPEDREISTVLALIEKMPDSTLALNQLSILYIKRARRTGDFALNAKAQAAVEKALSLSPKDGPTRKLQASLHLTYHRFTEALELGNELQKEFSNDAIIYGVLTDANAELGNYADAVAAAQKMVDLKPNSSSYARAAHMRLLHGDQKGAEEMYKIAARTADPQDKEAQSWCLVQLANSLWSTGQFADADRVYDEALQNFPNYHLALAGKGRNRSAQGDLTEAEKFLVEAQNRVPDPATMIQLGDIYTVQGNSDKARAQYDLVEIVEQKFGASGDRKQLALFWADRDIKLTEALAIAESEYVLLKDIYTSDVLAWCLYKAGNLQEAKKKISEAMRLKTNDSRILYHAGMIEKGLGNDREAVRLIAEALKLNPSFDLIQAGIARKALDEMKRNGT